MLLTAATEGASSVVVKDMLSGTQENVLKSDAESAIRSMKEKRNIIALDSNS